MKNPLNKIIKDPRDFQILYLSIFLIYGITQELQGFKEKELYFSITILSCLIAQSVGIFFTTKNYIGLKSGMITALGLCLLLKSDQLWVPIVSSVVAIGAKYLIRYKGKHIFNPANLGLIVALIPFTGNVSPGQWGSSSVFVYFVGALALIILLKVGRIDTSLIFLASLFAIQYVYIRFYLGDVAALSLISHSFSSGSLLLFAFFMITDPMTTPNHVKGRIVWSIALAVLTFLFQRMQSFQLLGYTHYMSAESFIWALFLISPITAFLDRTFKANKFEWLTTPQVHKF